MVRPHFFVRLFAFIIFAAFVLSATNLAAQSAIPFVNHPLVPSSVSPGSGELALTVNGTGFVSTSVVKWNGTPLGTAFVNSHQLVADVPSSALAAVGTASITVFTPTPGGGRRTPRFFRSRTQPKRLRLAVRRFLPGSTPAGWLWRTLIMTGRRTWRLSAGTSPTLIVITTMEWIRFRFFWETGTERSRISRQIGRASCRERV